ncbi:MAG: glutamine--fructose-6-phosphate transaminase (isomerizing) [Succinivibrionaceae bacterium]|nr:glutamine--fructose-6-phosphate transaminase (isomerizing) [Succinivibrionaceae bacterium]
MCGIVGAVAQRDVSGILLEGLRRLEYRGYDSAGIAVVNANHELKRIRSLGKVKDLVAKVEQDSIPGGLGIAHTRWATHGKPSVNNAHPHVSGSVALVHNGIIENYSDIKTRLIAKGFKFDSETDTEALVHLIAFNKRTTPNLLAAVQKTVKEIRGAYGTVIIDSQEPNHLIAARSGSPIVIGLGIGENFVASDPSALLPVTRRFIFLQEGDIADITRFSITIYDQNGQVVERPVTESELLNDDNVKGNYRHFMQKEIYEQGTAISNTLENRLTDNKICAEAFGAEAPAIFKKVENIRIIACGTSYHAGLIARQWFEEYLDISTQVEIASEFRYRKSVKAPNTLFVTLSQSGETADTLAALRLAKEQGYMSSLAICNVPDSSLVRESELVFLTRAGREIGVASTKAFTTQLIALLLLMGAIGSIKGILTAEAEQDLIKSIKSVSGSINEVLKLDASIEKLSLEFVNRHNSLFLGRGSLFPVALEGALKLKEISYIHAEGYAAGELKHGPLALIDSDMPVIVVAPKNDLFEKLKSNIEEVAARGGILYVFKGRDIDFGDNDSANIRCIDVPEVDDLIAPIVYTVPLQLLAYHVAIIKGTDVDQPRNLAKSVTVE